MFFKKTEGKWQITARPSKSEKGPHRYGGFKDAFRNNMIFVYATKGSKEENEWYYNKARFDAEKFYYSANGNVEIIRDVDFNSASYKNRNIILYGNRDNDVAWDLLLSDSPIQIRNDRMEVGNRILEGDQYGAYFIYPRSDSEIASIGVITATGEKGMRGAYANNYLENGTFYPDVVIFDDTMMKKGISGVKCSGFFNNSWAIEEINFYWR